MAPRIGAHVPGGAGRLVESARACDAHAVQIFASNPRGWATPATSEAEDRRAGESLAAAGLGPLFIHAPYLVNLASPSDEFRQKSRENLAWTVRRGTALGAAGVVVHAGSAVGAPRADALALFREAMLRVLDDGEALGAPPVLIELTAGGSGTLACRWEQAGEMLAAVDAHPRVLFCLDTCHAHAAGYDLSSPDGVAACLAEMRDAIGDRLALVHANDSRDPCGSRRDRHWHIAEGSIGADGFRALLAHEAARDVPFVIETPDGKAHHARNVATLRSLAP